MSHPRTHSITPGVNLDAPYFELEVCTNQTRVVGAVRLDSCFLPQPVQHRPTTRQTTPMAYRPPRAQERRSSLMAVTMTDLP